MELWIKDVKYFKADQMTVQVRQNYRFLSNSFVFIETFYHFTQPQRRHYWYP